MPGLAGRVVIVTGAAGGIGAATARALRKRDAHVLAVDIDAAALARLEQECGATGVVADVRDPTHATQVVDRAMRDYDRIDVVVANAGIGHFGAFADMSAERIDDVLSVNVRAPMLLARAALPAMLARGRGALLFVTSVVGVLPVPRESVYSASKAALEAFVVPLREELRGTGIVVSAVRPAVVATAFFDERGEPYLRQWPRPVSPDVIAEAIVQAVERGTETVTAPGWYVIPMRVRAWFPRLYRVLARRFG